MGGCLSCSSVKTDENKDNVIISKEELRKIMIDLAEKHEFLDVEVIENEEINDYYDRCQTKNEVSVISDGSERIKFEIFDYESSNSEENNIDRRESKRKKSSHITDVFKCSPSLYKDAFSCESYHLGKLSDYSPMKDIVLNTSLTIEEVDENLKKEDAISPGASAHSINSSFLLNLKNQSDFSDYMEDIADHPDNQKSEYDISVKELFNSNFLNYCQRGRDSQNLSRINPKSVIKEKEENDLLNVLKACEIVKQDQKIVKEETSHLAYLQDRQKAEETFNLFFHVNKYNQNVIHQLVLTKNYTLMKTILECLVHLKKIRMFLETVDTFSNTPFAYTVITNDTEMAKILLSFDPKIPSICYSTIRDNWIPILHNAYQSAIQSSGENIFLLICNYLSSQNNKELFENILDTRDMGGQTILHHIILDYHPREEKMGPYNVLDYTFYIEYLIKIGANLETKCPCASRPQIQVDVLGQATFSNYPLELLKQIVEYPSVKNANFTWNYIYDDTSYTLDELVLLRTDLDLEYKWNVITILGGLS